MATSVQDRDQAAAPGAHRAARTGYRWLLLAFLLIGTNAGLQYTLARRR